MAAWFNKKTARAMAKMADNLRAETRARVEAEEKLKAEIEAKSEMERKVKAEAEKMLLTQFNKYNVMVEEAEAKAKEVTETTEVQIKEAEEKILSYEAALARSEEKLIETQKKLRAEVLVRMQAEEMLKSESEERKKIEAQIEESIAAAKAKAEKKLKSEIEKRKKIEAQVEEAIAASNVKVEEKIQSDESALTKAQQKLIDAKERVKKNAVAKSKQGIKAKEKGQQRFLQQPEEGVYTLGRNQRHFFHLDNLKRKIVLLVVLIIFSALTFALSVVKDPLEAQTDDMKVQGEGPERVALAGSDGGRERPSTDAAAVSSPGRLDDPASSMTKALSLNYESSDNITSKVIEEKSEPDLETHLSTITINPEPLRITAAAGGKNNIVQFSDDIRSATSVGSQIYFEFSDVSIPSSSVIRSAVLFVEHFEEERFVEGKLEWAIGTGWPGRPVVWATMTAPVHHGESNESVDAWDITSVVNTVEKINSVQLQIKNNNAAKGKTLVDYAYVVIKYH